MTGRECLTDVCRYLDIAGARYPAVRACLQALDGIETGREGGARARLRQVLAVVERLAPHDKEVAAAELLIRELVGLPALERVTCTVDEARPALPAAVLALPAPRSTQ